MKMKKLLTSVLLISLITVSCKKDETEAPVVTDSNAATVLESNNAYLMEAAANTAVQVQNTESNSNNQPVTTPSGMNPPHGQPGHRCEIAVGAPLNSTPNTANKPQTTTLNSTTSQTNTPQVVAPNNNNGAAVITTTNQNTPAGMNPPHGQEGHVCSIAVGAPLPK